MDQNRDGIAWVDAGIYDASLKGSLAPKPGTFTTDNRYNYDNPRFSGGRVNERNDGSMTCDMCGTKGHGKAECGMDYTKQPLKFQRNGKTHLTWRYLWNEKLCGPYGMIRR